MTQIRMTTLITAAVFFLCIGTFTSVSVQGAYQVLFALPLAYYVWQAKGRNFRLPASGWWLLAFSFVAVLSILVNWADVPKPGKNLGRVKYFVMAALGIFPVGVWLKHVSDRTRRRLQRWLGVSLIVGTSWLLWQKFGLKQAGLKSLTENMRYTYGSSLLSVLLLGLSVHYLQVRSWFSRRWGLLCIALSLLGIVLINSRGAQAGFLLSIPFVLYFWRPKIALVLGLVFAIAGGALAWHYVNGKNEKDDVRILRSMNNRSDIMRRSQWQSAWIAFKEKPVLGWGMSNLHTQVKRIKAEHQLDFPNYAAHAHNIPLELLAGTGVIGFLVFLGWFLTWAWECWSAGGLTRAIMIPFFVAIAFQAQFEVLLDANNATWISFLYAITLARDKRYQLSFV